MKKHVFILLAMVMALSVYGCGSEVLTDDEIATLAQERVIASEPLNQIYFGEGLPVDIMRASVGNYQFVSSSSAYQSISQIKEETQEIFSSEYCQILFQNAFSGINEDGVGIVYARYAEKDNELMINSEIDPLITETRIYNFDTLKVSEKSSKQITVEIETEDESGTKLNVRLKLIKENDLWLLDSPTY